MYIKDKKEHTDDQGWTTIAPTSKRKPKNKTSQQSNIDSIIASINLDFKPMHHQVTIHPNIHVLWVEVLIDC
jgi:hypothetical protein